MLGWDANNRLSMELICLVAGRIYATFLCNFSLVVCRRRRRLHHWLKMLSVGLGCSIVNALVGGGGHMSFLVVRQQQARDVPVWPPPVAQKVLI